MTNYSAITPDNSFRLRAIRYQDQHTFVGRLPRAGPYNSFDSMLICLITTSMRKYCATNKVRGWERTLNRVNETLDMWYTVQRKWMYLESIFVGAEDIRLQLPEEAKKFDAIDKAFKQARLEILRSAMSEALLGISDNTPSHHIFPRLPSPPLPSSSSTTATAV